MAERGMGRGLAAILPVSGQHGDRPELRDLSIELIEPNPRSRDGASTRRRSMRSPRR